MISKKTLVWACGAVTLAAMAQMTQAAIVMIDPDGPAGINPAVQVGSIDLLPGNALNKDALAGGGAAIFTNYYQARVAALLDSSGNVIPILGLNDPASPNSFELTIVAQFNLAVTGQNAGPGTVTTTTALAVSPTNFVRLFYDGNVDASDLAGTGFANGTQILNASATAFAGTFIELLALPPAVFDNFGANNYPGVLSSTGIGGAAVDAAIASTDPTFFIAPPSAIGMNFSTTNAMPFSQTNPSAQFLGIPANIGGINGVSGPDIQVQADAAVSFAVPEPGSLGLLGAASLALNFRRRHRRR